MEEIKMSDQQWSALEDFFKQRFPACHKCQKGCHEDPDTMLAHLVSSHYEREANLFFGDGLFCSVCGQRLARHEESRKKYHVLGHMIKHFDLIVPRKAKHLLLGSNKTVASTKRIFVSKSPVNENNTSNKICMSEKLLIEIDCSEDEEIDPECLGKGNGSRAYPSDLQDEGKEESRSPYLDQINSKSTLMHKSQKVSGGNSPNIRSNKL